MIYVVRHGQTDWNKEGRLQGRQGLPLNERGIEQAESLREQLSGVSFASVYSSPQERAVQTAERIAGKQAVTDARLDVFDLGEADGQLRSKVTMAGGIPDPTLYSGVEEIRLFIRRVFTFMDWLKEQHGASGEPILISGHRCTTGCIGAYFEGTPQDGNLLKYSSSNGEYKVYRFR
ncbi:hypothetical protein J31TS4_27280 [Paenibacillus sp. J31TS4]|uniref:histidine phosphatase family protein n=1 Tax=Paenibacillus sp. J31TS4 TaxID=2807195 RepID=UPI001B091170|nr:histidine phosphatase family protein [Paenibacillus sp. J31TS4]GIP39448.1 hypothetical protein J31TS4_27280 [Paenibacillus sp. J31TS4]